MNSLFTLDSEGHVIYSPYALNIKEFKAINDRDESNDKRYALIDLSAAFFLASVSSLNYLRGESKKDRIQSVADDYYGGDVDRIIKDKHILEAAGKIIDIEDKSIMKAMLRTSIKGLDKLRAYLEDVDLTKTDESGKPIHDAKKYQGILQDMVITSKRIKELENAVAQEEGEADSRLKGNVHEELEL